MISDIQAFLGSVTPKAWVDRAITELDTLLLDHKNCEYKAASNALQMMNKYVTHEALLHALSRLAREELVHYDQVMKLMKKRKMPLRTLSASRYAAGLRALIRPRDPEKLTDLLLISAFIEARSCERFSALIPYLDDELAKFYSGLLASEARHYQGYIKLAHLYGEATDIAQRIDTIRVVEQDLIGTPDSEFRFHSGLPA
jgi:tRNA 2-(methylsulfanyl)-N6-isopentenyladenosine37 hydroxylase